MLQHDSPELHSFKYQHTLKRHSGIAILHLLLLAQSFTARSQSNCGAQGSAWLSLSFKADEEARAIVMSDLAGRTIDRVMVGGNEGQVIWDCRRVPAGTYLVSLYASSGALLAVQRAIIKP